MMCELLGVVEVPKTSFEESVEAVKIENLLRRGLLTSLFEVSVDVALRHCLDNLFDAFWTPEVFKSFAFCAWYQKCFLELVCDAADDGDELQVGEEDVLQVVDVAHVTY